MGVGEDTYPSHIRNSYYGGPKIVSAKVVDENHEFVYQEHLSTLELVFIFVRYAMTISILTLVSAILSITGVNNSNINIAIIFLTIVGSSYTLNPKLRFCSGAARTATRCPALAQEP